jgi:hypothetical protein
MHLNSLNPKQKLHIIVWLGLVIPAFIISCLLFPTQISGEELERRIREHYPEAFQWSPSPDPAQQVFRAEIDRQNHAMLSEFEVETFREEQWLYRRIPATVVLWLALVFGYMRWVGWIPIPNVKN